MSDVADRFKLLNEYKLNFFNFCSANSGWFKIPALVNRSGEVVLHIQNVYEKDDCWRGVDDDVDH